MLERLFNKLARLKKKNISVEITFLNIKLPICKNTRTCNGETSVSAIDKIFAYQGAQGFELHERKTKSIDYIVRASVKLTLITWKVYQIKEKLLNF